MVTWLLRIKTLGYILHNRRRFVGTSVVTVSLLAFCYCPETGVSLSNRGCLRLDVTRVTYPHRAIAVQQHLPRPLSRRPAQQKIIFSYPFI